MLVGVLHGDSQRDYQELCGGAPIQMIKPPVVWLSTPQEGLTSSLSRRLADDTDLLVVELRPVMFRNLYNPMTKITGMYAACTPTDGTTPLMMRTKLGVKASVDDFIPNFLICHDAMRSDTTRSFFRSFADMLAKRSFSWLLFEASNHKPDHQVLFENYNPHVIEEMAQFKMFSGDGTDYGNLSA